MLMRCRCPCFQVLYALDAKVDHAISFLGAPLQHQKGNLVSVLDHPRLNYLAKVEDAISFLKVRLPSPCPLLHFFFSQCHYRSGRQSSREAGAPLGFNRAAVC